MRILCYLVAAVFAGLCSGEGYWDIQLSPNSITSVPFGAGHISVWEHAHTRGRYYAMPLVHLLYASADTLENIVTGITELNFGVLMWSLEAREAVYRHLKAHVNSTIVQEQVELLPMEKIRIVWRDRVRPLSRHFKLADQWRSNTHLPSTVTFQFVCAENEKCEQLKNAMRTTPAMFNALEMEYIINGQRSARRSMTIGSTHFIRGNLYTQLKNMPVSSAQRYLTSDDVKRLTSETVSNVIASVITDADYVDTGDEVSMSDVLQHVLQRQEVSTASFAPQMWESVFWDPTFARPDKLTAYLNKVLSKDTSDSRKFLLDESQRSWSAEGGGGGSFMGIISVQGSAGGSSNRQSKVQKEDVLNTLKERHNHIEWTGEQFRVKPMKLYRLNLSTLNTSTNIATANIQVRRYETVQGIKLRVSEEPQTPSLTPQLVEQRLTAKLANQTSEFDNKMQTTIRSLKALVDQRTARTERKIGESTQGWQGRFNTLERITNAWPDYCERHNVDCQGRDLRHYHTDLARCRAHCSATCACVALVHRGNDCWLKNERCPVAHLRTGGNFKYLVKASRAPVSMGMWKWALTNTKADYCSDPCRMFQ